MVDETTPTAVPDADDPLAPPLDPETGGRKTNVAVVVAAVLGFLVIAGLAAAAVFVFVLRDTVPDLVVDQVPPPAEATSTVDPVLGDPVEPAPVPLTAVFTFRDIFDPLLKPLPEPTEPGTTPDGSGVPTSTAGIPQDTLVLMDVVEQNDGYAGVFAWNGELYTLGPGGRIPDSPWEVVSVSPSEVVMLYGDIRVTLTIGSRVVK